MYCKQIAAFLGGGKKTLPESILHVLLLNRYAWEFFPDFFNILDDCLLLSNDHVSKDVSFYLFRVKLWWLQLQIYG